MTTRQVVIYPVHVNEIPSLPADWFSRTRKLPPGLVHAMESSTQQLDDVTLDVLSVSCDWQIKTAGDAPHSSQMNEEKLRRLELIRAAAEGRK